MSSSPTHSPASQPDTAQAKALLSQQRRAQIVALVQREGTMRVGELAARFDVSAVTIRSDLAALESEGRVVRDHGGASAPRTGNTFVTSLLRVDERSGLHLEKKRRIGEAAARLVAPGDAILLDAGTTSVEIARRLAHVAPLTVVTNALNVALELGASADQRLILLGGAYHRESSSTVGRIAAQSLAELAVQTLFLGAQAMDAEQGLTDSTMEIAEVKRAMIRAARQVVLVTDSSKWGRTSLTRVAALDEIDILVTDHDLPVEARELCERLEIKLILV